MFPEHTQGMRKACRTETEGAEMNKKILAWLTVTVMMISCLAGAFAEPVTIQPDMKLKADDSAVQAIVKENPE